MGKKPKSHDIQNISFCGSTIHLAVDGCEHEVNLLDVSYRLGGASQEQRENVRVENEGVGLYWPLLDEGILVDVLIGKKKMQPHQARDAWEEYITSRTVV